MPTHLWSVLCNRWSIDEATNNVVLDALEQVAIDLTPPGDEAGHIFSVPLHAHLVTLWHRDPHAQDPSAYRVVLELPGGETYPTDERAIDLSSATRLRSAMELPAIPVDTSLRGPADYWFHVEYRAGGDWMRVARVPLEVTVTIAAPRAS